MLNIIQVGHRIFELDVPPQKNSLSEQGPPEQPPDPLTKLNTPPSPSRERVGMGSPSGITTKQARIPSTGNRATVMEVAQALNDTVGTQPQDPEPLAEPNALPEPVPLVGSPISEDLPPLPEPNARPRPNIAQLQAEKRRSTYERYSAVIMPPLKEEATPTPSPAGTFKPPSEPSIDIPLQRMFEVDKAEQSEVRSIQTNEPVYIPAEGECRYFSLIQSVIETLKRNTAQN